MEGRLRTAAILAALTVPLIAIADGGVPGRYMWPLEGKTNISAGFGDYRTRHFHGGIDISTGGQEGFPVRAADSGWVMRVATSYWGFGKVVYIRLAGGRVAVYGHLSELAPKIQKYVEDNQYAAERYLQNLLPAPGEIPISKGEIVGKTGQTGAGPAHLHFELRTDADRPLNPLVTAFQKPDKTAPSIHSITIIPRQPDLFAVPLSLVDGKPAPATYEFSGLPGGRVLGTTPVASGVFGIAVRTDDIIDSPEWVVSAYHCRLWANDALVCEVHHDSLDYRDTRLIELERTYDGKSGFAERAINLFRRPGNRLWNYTNTNNDGWLEAGKNLHSGPNQMRLEVEDAAGNSAFADFQIEVGPAPPPAAGNTGAEKNPAAIVWSDNGIFLPISGTRGAEPAGFLDYGLTKPLQPYRTASGVLSVWLPAEQFAGLDSIWTRTDGQSSAQRLRVKAVSSFDSTVVKSADGRAAVQFGPGDLYQASFFQLNRDKAGPKARKAVSELYSLQPTTVPFVRAVRMGIEFEGGSTEARRVALYRYRSESNNWEFVGSEYSSDEQVISGKIECPGSFALLADSTRPSIRDFTPAKSDRIRDRQPMIHFVLSDDLAGIGSDTDIVMTIDDHWTVVEYNPETQQAKAQPRNPLTPGDHRLVLTVKDRVGNETKLQRTLTILK
ncbi:MAG: M23 family metallopeptidase [candidate division Zixibacteria bacterium]|nr:M23 family metallopeptidase [candidate division Zixibacteria bacterium]